MEWTFLVNCSDEFQAGMIIGFLEEEGIPSMQKYKGSGDYMKIITGVGKDVDILVPEKDHARAKEILESLKDDDTE